jgi:hypothetical protein
LKELPLFVISNSFLLILLIPFQQSFKPTLHQNSSCQDHLFPCFSINSQSSSHGLTFNTVEHSFLFDTFSRTTPTLGCPCITLITSTYFLSASSLITPSVFLSSSITCVSTLKTLSQHYLMSRTSY